MDWDAIGALAEKLGISLQEAIIIESQCQGWWWIHWAQWASISTEKDIDELKHLVFEFYSVPPMSITWKESGNSRLLDPEFQKFINETAFQGK